MWLSLTFLAGFICGVAAAIAWVLWLAWTVEIP